MFRNSEGISIKGKTEDKDRAYRINLYNVDKAKLDTIHVPVEYIIDSEGYMTFKADNIKIEPIFVEGNIEN